MDKSHKITIPEPCHENWDKMTPKDNGRFCLSCAKTVVDFSKMLPEEIQQYFISNQGKSICGRFKKTQIDNIIIQIPSRVLYSQNNYHKMFLLALFIVMGTTLFSCTDKNGDKQKIDKVEVIKTSKKEIIQVGDVKISKNSSFQVPPPPPPKVDQVKFVKPISNKNAENAKFKEQTKSNCSETVAQDAIEDDGIYISGAAIITQANYPGGIKSFNDFFLKEFKIPEEAENSKSPIIVSFIIERDGSLASIDIPKNTDSKIGAEIKRVLDLSPKWIPGEQNGKKTREKYSFPISFQ